MNAEPELPFELAAAYSVARTLPRNKLLLSIHAKNGISVLRLMGPGLKVELDRWSYRSEDETRNVVYNWKLTAKYIREQAALPEGDRTFLIYDNKGVFHLVHLLLKPENV